MTAEQQAIAEALARDVAAMHKAGNAADDEDFANWRSDALERATTETIANSADALGAALDVFSILGD